MRRSKEDADQTRTAILDAAELMFCDQGIAGSTLEKISRKAGVTRGALYWHFNDKIDLLRALHDRSDPPQRLLIRLAAEQGHSDPLALLQQAATDLLITFEQDERLQRVFVIMTTQSTDEDRIAWIREMNDDMFQSLSALTQQAHDQGSLSPDFTPQEIARIMVATMNGLLSEWLRADKCFSLSDLGARFMHRQMALFRRQTS